MIPFFTAVKSFFTPFINVWNSGISYFCAVLIHSSNFAAFFENITLQKSLVNVYSSLNKGYFLILPDTILQWLFLYPQVFYKSAGTKLSFAHIQNAASPFPSVHAFMFFLFVWTFVTIIRTVLPFTSLDIAFWISVVLFPSTDFTT